MVLRGRVPPVAGPGRSVSNRKLRAFTGEREVQIPSGHARQASQRAAVTATGLYANASGLSMDAASARKSGVIVRVHSGSDRAGKRWFRERVGTIRAACDTRLCLDVARAPLSGRRPAQRRDLQEPQRPWWDRQRASRVWTDLPPSGQGLPRAVGNPDGGISLRSLSNTRLA